MSIHAPSRRGRPSRPGEVVVMGGSYFITICQRILSNLSGWPKQVYARIASDRGDDFVTYYGEPIVRIYVPIRPVITASFAAPPVSGLLAAPDLPPPPPPPSTPAAPNP